MKDDFSPEALPYNRTTAARILRRLDAGEGTRKACKAEGVSLSTFFTWEKERPEFKKELVAQQVARRMAFTERLMTICQEVHKAAQDTENAANRLQALAIESDIIRWHLENAPAISCADYATLTAEA